MCSHTQLAGSAVFLKTQKFAWVKTNAFRFRKKASLTKGCSAFVRVFPFVTKTSQDHKLMAKRLTFSSDSHTLANTRKCALLTQTNVFLET
ncbi:hypothetical protein B9Q02_10120 [Candidatus Marsarchaeota G1 archaeon BE_D]|uniref:Uncharacterized protein n=1 Tax=Candidatus Marsarchaeota G1 archaeon BE_D TaxID=1978156 RepID=A0A2R6ABT7_9ARCH|nr:MAG: hypothetical protein B9Q02_10120 [Candidatus Marsarchaeota G1 archaeon BE_D]